MKLVILSALVASATALYGNQRRSSVDYYSTPDYTFSRATADPFSGVANTAEETRLGERTEGSYSTYLPDGRKQTVTYWVDGDSGYNANVKYDGVAHHPDAPARSRAGRGIGAGRGAGYGPVGSNAGGYPYEPDYGYRGRGYSQY